MWPIENKLMVMDNDEEFHVIESIPFIRVSLMAVAWL